MPNQAIPEGEPLEEEVLEIPTSSDQINIGLFITLIAIAIAIIFIIMILKKRKIAIDIMRMPSYSFQPIGLNKRKTIKNKDLKLLSTTNALRLAYQDFEKEAHLARASRLAGETVKEWFRRMEWESELIMTYDKVRYGSCHTS